MSKTITEKLDEVLGANTLGYTCVEGGYDSRVVYVRANRLKRSRMKTFVEFAKRNNWIPEKFTSDHDCTGNWIEAQRELALIGGNYCLVSRQVRDC